MGDIDTYGNLKGLRSQEQTTLRELRTLESQLKCERTKYISKLQDCIHQLKEKLDMLKSEVHGDFKMELRDEEYYRVNMFQLESKITHFKQFIKSELCALLEVEMESTRDLQMIERRLDEWSKPLNVRSLKPITSAYAFPPSSDEPDATSDFQNFLASSGGHTGGWEQQDHYIFMRERKKYNGKSKYIAAVHSFLPDISEEEITAHENWYKRYEELKSLQKEAIRKWRAARSLNTGKEAISPNVELEMGDVPRARTYASQRNITERIKEWKRQQQLKKEKEEELQREELQRQHEERLRKRDIHKSKKLVVEKYKAAKMSKLQEEMLSQQMRELQAVEDRARKGVLLQAFREQDQQFLEKKRMQKLQNELKERKKVERLKKMKTAIEIERDAQRVLQPTQVWVNRCSQQEQSKPHNFRLDTIPRLAIPNWRKGLDYTQTL